MEITLQQYSTSSDSSTHPQETAPLRETPPQNPSSKISRTVGKIIKIVGGLKVSLGLIGATMTVIIGLYNYDTFPEKFQYLLAGETTFIIIGLAEVAAGMILEKSN